MEELIEKVQRDLIGRKAVVFVKGRRQGMSTVYAAIVEALERQKNARLPSSLELAQ